MTRRNALLGPLAVAALMGPMVFGQGKPNFTGTWELTEIDRYGMKLVAGKTIKETQIWVHQEPKLTIKMMVWADEFGYRNLELTYNTNGTKGAVGYRSRPDGTKDEVLGSAHWEGNRLVYEQEFPNAKTGQLRRIIRTCTLETDGPKLVAEQVQWMAGTVESTEAKWTWTKKSSAP
jgi:hypothetical protein